MAGQMAESRIFKQPRRGPRKSSNWMVGWPPVPSRQADKHNVVGIKPARD